MAHPLFLTVSGVTNAEIGSRFIELVGRAGTLPKELYVDEKEPPTNSSLEELLSKSKREFYALWPDASSRNRDRNSVSICAEEPAAIRIANYFTRAEEVLSLIEELPGTLFAMNSVWPDEWPDDRTVRRYGFGNGHTDLGWGCAFKGEGHDRLVSRRWLDYGPWRVLRGKNDTTLIQFHDLSLGPEESFAQARIAHDRMGISRQGGFIQRPVVYFNELKGLYDAATRTFKMVVHGRELSQAEMLDAATYGIEMRTDPKTPIDHVAYVFIEEAEAQKHLHELWLRGLQCIAIRNGAELRLDEAYHPTPDPPDWVKALDPA